MDQSQRRSGKETIIDLNDDTSDDDFNNDSRIDDISSYSLKTKNFDELTTDDVFSMTFNTQDAAEKFYNMYAKVLGFSVRKDDLKRDKNNVVISRRWVCSKEGQRLKKYLEQSDRQREPRDLTRVGCHASFRVFYNRETDKWIVKEFFAEHNHPMVEPISVHFLNSHRSIKSADKAQVRSMKNVGVKTSQIMDYMVSQSGGYENVGFTQTDLYNHVDAVRREATQDGDAQAALTYFVAKSEMDPSFYFKFNVDDQNRLQSLFWTDSRSRLDYTCFGDVLAFDTTYKTNSYKKPLVILVGVNHHHQTIVFGCALLLNETIETYIWVLETLLDAMNNKRPVSVITDGDNAMAGAIHVVFRDAKHRLCSWHLHRNAMLNVKIEGFASDFQRCMALKCTPQEFEIEWQNMIIKYEVQNIKWVRDTYATRTKWAEAHLRGHFFAGMRSTQRCESMNSYLNGFLRTGLKLFEFVRQYDRALARIRQRELKAEFVTSHSEPVLTTALHSLERHAASVFTRKMFLKIRKEIKGESIFFVVRHENHANFRAFTVSQFRRPESRWVIYYYFNDQFMQCSCLEYETSGIPCRHLISVMKFEHLEEIPSRCIMARWTKFAKSHIQQENDMRVNDDVTIMMRCSALSSMCNRMCYLASQSPEYFQEARGEIARLTYRFEELYTTESNVNRGEVHELGQSNSEKVLDPEVVKTKGNPGGSSVRRCGHCKCVGHDRRTCKRLNGSFAGPSSNTGESQGQNVSNPQRTMSHQPTSHHPQGLSSYNASVMDSNLNTTNYSSQTTGDMYSFYHAMYSGQYGQHVPYQSNQSMDGTQSIHPEMDDEQSED